MKLSDNTFIYSQFTEVTLDGQANLVREKTYALSHIQLAVSVLSITIMEKEQGNNYETL